MDKTSSLIYFYVWKINAQSENMLMTDTTSSSSAKHSWTTLDGNKVETPSTFPPYKDIILGENQNTAKAIQ